MATATETSVRLECGFPSEFVSKLWGWLNDPRDANFDDYGPRTFEEFAKELAFRIRTTRIWTVIYGGEIVGYVAFAPQSPICGQFQGMTIAPRYRGVGIGKRAMLEALLQLSKDGFEKFISMPFVDNAPIMRILESFKFQQEGYLTAAARRDGKPLDIRVMCFPGQAGAEV